MNKRKCGTCRFYQEARLASSGWCHHPQRKVTSDLMIMVRKNELACRDEWAHDLWEAAANPTSAAGSPAFSGHLPDRRMPPATELEIAAVLRSDTSPSSSDETSTEQAQDDVVLSELGIPETNSLAGRPDPLRYRTPLESNPSAGTPAEPRPRDSGTRSAIIRAREAYRERGRLLAARSSEIARLAAEADATRIANESAAQSPSESTTPETRVKDQLDASLPTVAGTIEAVASRLSVPSTVSQSTGTPTDPLAGWIDSPVTPKRETEADQDQAPQPPSPRFGAAAEAKFEPQADPADDSAAEARDRRASSFAVPDNDPASARLPVEDVELNAGPPQAGGDWSWSRDVASTAVVGHRSSEDLDPPTTSDLLRAPSWIDDVAYDNIESSEGGAAPTDTDVATAPAEFDLETDDVIVDSDRSHPAPHFEIAAHLSRTCRNCRDFRPSETGERGWCANQWAFSHRRMVDANERTPCESSLGHWWLPVDEVWSEAADVSAHGQPTPLVDSWLHPQPERVPTRRRS